MRNATITEFLGDGPQDFRLGFGQFLELQEKTGVGPYTLYRRLMGEDWMIADIYETVRIGLIGGGLKPKEAFILATRYVKEEPPMDNLNLARMIVIAGLMGAPDEDRAGSNNKKDVDSDDTLRSRDYYGFGGIMGLDAQQVDGMTLHQVKAAFDGFSDHHAAQAGGMRESEKEDLFDLVQEEQRKIDGVEDYGRD